MPLALIFDCGATNIRTIAVSESGNLIASHHIANETSPDLESPEYHIWDIERIWNALLVCAKNTIAKLNINGYRNSDIITIGVTTFGVDGALFNNNLDLQYPMISWKCPRTKEQVAKLPKLIDIDKFYKRNGIGQYSFNTLYKMLWLKENKQEIYNNFDYFLFISSIINYRLTGLITTDKTMAGTSMMTNLDSGDWDPEILSLLQLDNKQFPKSVSAGDIVGPLTNELTQELNLPFPPKVVSCGHDTQFALFGSGAKLDQPVLSSGTWEILMLRTKKAQPDSRYLNDGLTTEFDAIDGVFNPGVQWLGSGVLEWLKNQMFLDIKDSENYYEYIIEAASLIPPGSDGVYFKELIDENNQHSFNITGLNIDKNRIQIYRSALEHLSLKLDAGLNILQKISDSKTDSIICVGGGSKNNLWNQIRADVLNMPIDIVDMPETTVLGAAMFAFSGVGFFRSPQEAQDYMAPNKTRIYPSANQEIYKNIFIENGRN
ncbi:L-fuculokinase [Vibrio salinus]|uniref:L-fuculokinase n=1 Tax=Vibrio salinus TaxID=2899784 RepID=UPI001E5DDDEC|nr:L-fuculokinase [Vibrio salinus]MCE0492412.1 L-fuculokinase [Vibrio salinus]